MFERLLDTPLNLRNLINTAFVLSNFEKTILKIFRVAYYYHVLGFCLIRNAMGHLETLQIRVEVRLIHAKPILLWLLINSVGKNKNRDGLKHVHYDEFYLRALSK